MAKRLSGTGNVVKSCLFKVIDGAISEQYIFKFNYVELNTQMNAEYNLLSPPGSFMPTAIYKSTTGKNINFTVLLDQSERATTTGIFADLSFLESLVIPDISTALASSARWTSPPRLILVVGYRSWDVVCTNVVVAETKYNRAMTPVRAMVDLSFQTIFVSQEELRRYLTETEELYSHRVIR